MLVFKHLQAQSNQQGLELLISKPSDLFQIDTSYLHANKTLTLILHVPMVAEENKLNKQPLQNFLCKGRSVLRTDI